MKRAAMLADHLDSRIDAIIAVWRSSALRLENRPEAERLTYREFADDIPVLLDRLADRLRGQSSDVGSQAGEYGRLRQRQGYDAARMVLELGRLRTILMEATFSYAHQHQFDLATMERTWRIICEVMNEATSEAVGDFQHQSQAELQATVRRLEQRQKELDRERGAAETERSRLRIILNRLPVAVWVLDATGSFVMTNDEVTRIRSIFPSDSMGSLSERIGTLPPVFRADGTPCPVSELPAVRALAGETVQHAEIKWQIAGEWRSLLVNAAPLLDAAGAVTGAVIVAQDVTERRRAEARLAESEARFRGIAEHSPVMIWRTGADGQCDYVNQTYLEFRGRGLEQVTGEGWVEGIHPDDRAAYTTAFRVIFERREPFEQTVRILRADGQYRWITSHGTPYHDAQGQFLGYLGSSVDITPRIELEAVLDQQRELAQEASQHKSRLLTALSHDARTPLNAVVLAAQLLEMHCNGMNNPEVQDCLRTIRHAVGNVLELLGDLLDLTKIDAGAQPAELSRFPLEPVLVESLATIETQARMKQLDVRLEPGPLAGAVVETDRSKLKQVLCNLLSNALRYTERGQIRLVGECSEDLVRLSVVDTGLGIHLADQQRIFDEFATLTHPQGQPGEGTGLGLAICRRLASLLRGEIQVQSTPDRGSTFTLVLPASILSFEPLQQPVSTAAVEADASGIIVVAEDHVSSRQTLARLLRQKGYRVLEAANGRDVLALAQSEPPLAVLMDVNMPIMDGIDATRALRADPQLCDVPIFALTGDVSLLNQRRIGEAGVNGYLEKPVTWERLQQALGTLKRS